MTVEHPAKVDAIVNASGALNDFAIVAKALAHGENACQQKRRVDRRDFAVPTSLTCFRVHPVIEPAALIESSRIEKAKCVACAFEGFSPRDPTTIRGDTE